MGRFVAHVCRATARLRRFVLGGIKNIVDLFTANAMKSWSPKADINGSSAKKNTFF